MVFDSFIEICITNFVIISVINLITVHNIRFEVPLKVTEDCCVLECDAMGSCRSLVQCLPPSSW